MNGKAVVLLLSGLLVACVQTAPSAPPAAPAPALPPAAPPPPAAETPKYQDRFVAIRNVSCGALLSAAEDDRAAASMFFIGYTASRLGRAKIDVAELDGLEATALGYCEAYPDRTAASAFVRAFRYHLN